MLQKHYQLCLIIFSLSFVCANENLTQGSNTDEITTLSISNEHVSENLNYMEYNSIDDSSSNLNLADDTQDTKEIEDETSLTSKAQLRANNDLERYSDENDIDLCLYGCSYFD